jgi:hypothetical protein
MKCYSCSVAKGGEIFMDESCMARGHAPEPHPNRDVPRWDFEARAKAEAKAKSPDIDSGTAHRYASGRLIGSGREGYDKIRYQRLKAEGKR